MNLKAKSIFRSAIAFCLFASLAGCGEKVPLKAPNSIYEISYSGNLLIGEEIQFQSSTPADKAVLWKFGDGVTSTQHSPKHTYYSLAHNGNTIVDDTVILIVDNDIYRPNVQLLRLKPGVNKLSGAFNWKGGFFSLHGNCCPGLVDTAKADTIFNLSVLDSMTIVAWGTPLPYLPDSNYYSNERSVGIYNATWIRYTKDTIFFRQRSGSREGWAQTTYFHKI